MSRTYRKFPTGYKHWKNDYIPHTVNHTDMEEYEYGMGISYTSKYNEKNKDTKPWFKPNKTYKQLHRRKEKAEVKHALRNGKDAPVHKKQDQYDWN
jgi:predicted HTH transcriptional regulator